MLGSPPAADPRRALAHLDDADAALVEEEAEDFALVPVEPLFPPELEDDEAQLAEDLASSTRLPDPQSTCFEERLAATRLRCGLPPRAAAVGSGCLGCRRLWS